jgi:hypothetical protein
MSRLRFLQLNTDEPSSCSNGDDDAADVVVAPPKPRTRKKRTAPAKDTNNDVGGGGGGDDTTTVVSQPAKRAKHVASSMTSMTSPAAAAFYGQIAAMPATRVSPLGRAALRNVPVPSKAMALARRREEEAEERKRSMIDDADAVMATSSDTRIEACNLALPDLVKASDPNAYLIRTIRLVAESYPGLTATEVATAIESKGGNKRPAVGLHERLFQHTPVMSADCERQQLRQAGDFAVHTPDGEMIVWNAPACYNGAKCRGMSCEIAGFGRNGVKGVVLMSFMYEDEFATFSATGVAPAANRPCVLCYRHTIAFMHTMMEADITVFNTNLIMQYYCNLVDQPGGYSSAYVMQPSELGWNGIVLPLAGYDPTVLHATMSDVDGAWRIDQSKMLFKPDF